MSAQSQSHQVHRGGPVSILCQLCAIAVTILVLIPSLRNNFKGKGKEGPSAASCNDAALSSNGWEIEPLPIMKNAKSRGFHPVYVYSKAIPEHREQYSQEKQDSLILALLDANNGKNATSAKNAPTTTPFFVDLAANDPLILSNTFLLEQNGWNGLCIEPNPKYWYRLAAYRTCTIIGAFVGGNQGEDGKEIDVNLSLGGGRKGGIVGQGMDNAGAKVEEKRNLVSILTVFQETNVPKVIDYFSLDVEGAETLVMKDFPWDTYAFKFITIERPAHDLKVLLQMNGYEMVRTISTYDETLWVNKKLVLLSEKEIDKISQKANIPSCLNGLCSEK